MHEIRNQSDVNIPKFVSEKGNVQPIFVSHLNIINNYSI